MASNSIQAVAEAGLLNQIRLARLAQQAASEIFMTRNERRYLYGSDEERRLLRELAVDAGHEAYAKVLEQAIIKTAAENRHLYLEIVNSRKDAFMLRLRLR